MTGPVMRNKPVLWRRHWPRLPVEGHKYDRGHVLVSGSPLEGSGATKLVAGAALRGGAGLVTVGCDEASLPVYAASFREVMVRRLASADAMIRYIAQRRVNSVAIGSGNGVTEETRRRVLSLTEQDGLALVLDADALSVFADAPPILHKALHGRCVLTPHEGEFARIFPDCEGSRESRAAQAARLSGAVIVLKGPKTVIASPDGQVCCNDPAPPTLSTGGSGDVLAGLIVGLLARGMPPFEAACAGVYLHTQAARQVGVGLIAGDLIDQLPAVLAQLPR